MRAARPDVTRTAILEMQGRRRTRHAPGDDLRGCEKTRLVVSLGWIPPVTGRVIARFR
jgi:hypothetical protein